MTEVSVERPRLLELMPEIAAAVNAFTSEEAQRIALEALIGAVSGVVRTQSAPPAPTPKGGDAPEVHDVVEAGDGSTASTAEAKANGRRSGRKGTAPKKTFNVPKDLNFAPEGQPSLEDFVAEKSPRTNDEKNLLACYYLRDMMAVPEISTGHVLAVYRAAGWSSPAHPDTALRGTAHRHGWIDTKNLKNITVPWAGDNFIRTKMPSPAPRGKAEK